MANETVITVVGNLTGDPNLRYTTSGAAVVDFTVASTPRTFDRNTNQWKDGETLFLRCSAWREYAENIAESLTKGTRVVVQGRLGQRSYTPRDGGEQRTVYELQVDEVGPSLRYAKAQVTRTPRQGGGGGGFGGGNTGGGGYGGGNQVGGGGGNAAFGGGYTQAPSQAPANDYSQGGFGAPAGGQDNDAWATPGSAQFDEDPPF